VHRASNFYRQFITGSLVLYLLDPEQPAIPQHQLNKALDVLESWMVRRMLVRATTKGYNQIVPEIVALPRRKERATAGDAIEAISPVNRSEAGIGRTMRISTRSLRDCSPTAVWVGGGCAWCWRQSKITDADGKMANLGSARSESHEAALR
jgi:hypothetical protein